jgi:DNA-binding NarL/FixJ family response regulator
VPSNRAAVIAREADRNTDQDQPLVLDKHVRSLVLLLVAGHTDASAARRLGVSPRTVTNMLRSLMDRLGVNNRFQLGVALGLRGAARAFGPDATHRDGREPGADDPP